MKHVHQFIKMYDRFSAFGRDDATSIQGYTFGKDATIGVVVMCAICGERRMLGYNGKIRLVES